MHLSHLLLKLGDIKHIPTSFKSATKLHKISYEDKALGDHNFVNPFQKVWLQHGARMASFVTWKIKKSCYGKNS